MGGGTRSTPATTGSSPYYPHANMPLPPSSQPKPAPLPAPSVNTATAFGGPSLIDTKPINSGVTFKPVAPAPSTPKPSITQIAFSPNAPAIYTPTTPIKSTYTFADTKKMTNNVPFAFSPSAPNLLPTLNHNTAPLPSTPTFHPTSPVTPTF